MRTVRTKVYSFDELTESAKQIAIENYRNNTECIDLGFFNDYAKEQITEAGFFGNVKLQYSLSYCQGDGLSFECNNFENAILLQFINEILGDGKQKTAQLILDNCTFECTGNKGSHYCYASRNDVNFEFDDYSGNKPYIHEVVSKVETKLKDLYVSLCDKLEKEGYEEIESLQSDEYISDTIIANEYEFTKDGNRF